MTYTSLHALRRLLSATGSVVATMTILCTSRRTANGNRELNPLTALWFIFCAKCSKR
mgnify:CR=1 FL=1